MEPDSLSLRTATTKLKVIWHFAFGDLHSAFSILQNTSYRTEVIPKYLMEPNGPLSLPNVLACSFQSFLPINCYRTVWGWQTIKDVIRLHMHSQPLPVPPSTPLDLHWPGTVHLRMRVQTLPPISNFIDDLCTSWENNPITSKHCHIAG